MLSSLPKTGGNNVDHQDRQEQTTVLSSGSIEELAHFRRTISDVSSQVVDPFVEVAVLLRG
jgi:hypothetical protein